MLTIQRLKKIAVRVFTTCLAGVALLLSVSKATAQCTGPVSGTFTINSAVATGGTNFQTVTEAVWSLACGVTGPVVFNVAPGSGPYIEQIVVGAIPGASATNTITFNGSGETLQFSSNNSALRACIQLDSAKHIIIDSFKIQPLTVGTLDFEYAYGVHIKRNSDSNVVKNCHITIINNNLNVQNNEGIVINGADDISNTVAASNCDGNLLMNNKISGGYNGIVLNSFTGYGNPVVLMNDNKVIGNIIYNYLHSAINMIYTNNTLVQGNDLDLPVQNSGGNVINLDELNQKANINGNKIHKFITNLSSPTGAITGVNIVYGKPGVGNGNLIVNNLFYDLPNVGQLRCISLETTTNVNVYHNTFALDNITSTGTGMLSGVYMDGTSTGLKINNNVFTISQSGSYSKYAIYAAATTVAFSSDNNDFYITSTGGTNAVGRFNGSNYSTMTTWRTATGKDTYSASVNPAYTNVAVQDFKPTSIPMDDLGLHLNIATDITGATRSNVSPDAGAYEFGAVLTACITPPNAGTSQAMPSTSFCGGGDATLKLTGNTVGVGQTYQWQSSATINGAYTNVGGLLTSSAIIMPATTTMFYRAEVICGGMTSYSTPVKITVNNTMSGDYTINKAEITGGRNYQSFADALFNMGCGVNGPVVITVVPNSGPYNEQVILTPVAGASNINTITFKGSNETLSYLSTNTNQRAVIKFDGADHFVIDSLKITALATAASGQYGFGVQMVNDADSNTVSNCVVSVSATNTTTAYAGICITGSATSAVSEGDTYCDGNTITGNTVTGGNYGITAVANTADASAIYNNRITNNTVKDFYAYGIYVTGTKGTLVEGNDLSRPTRTATNGTLYTIAMVTQSSGVKISKNRIHNLFGSHLTSTSTSYPVFTSSADGTAAMPNIISNNVIYDMNGAGPQYGLYNSGSDYALYYHNTISLEDITNASTAVTRGFYQQTAAAGIEFKNNMITIRRTGTSNKHAVYWNTPATTFASDFNNYYVASTSNTNYVAYRNATNYSLPNWVTANLKDSSSKALDPNYLNAAAGNFTPTLIPLDNLGTPVAISTDITGATRNISTPDIGAYEFDGTLPVKLLDISAIKTNSDVLVSWITASETNSKEFAIEWSLDGISFRTAGLTPASGNTAGFHNYSYSHKGIVPTVPGGVIFHRLKMIDKDGSFEYSKIVTIVLGKKAGDIVGVFPNPFVAAVYVRFTTANPGTAIVTVRDLTGRLITIRNQHVKQGSSLVEINNIGHLAAGIYMVGIELNGNLYNYKLSK
ncbi:MAG: right-handed parallel beta-helix repeat-containing protein [Bacteroidota bacterium]